MLKTMHDKKTYLAKILQQFVLTNYGKRIKECLHCLKIIFQKYITAKKYTMFYSKKHFHPD